jgi:hypothetical protein
MAGASIACACVDGRTGAQVCAADGTLGACVCAGPSGGDDASMSSGGAAGGTGSRLGAGGGVGTGGGSGSGGVHGTGGGGGSGGSGTGGSSTRGGGTGGSGAGGSSTTAAFRFCQPPCAAQADCPNNGNGLNYVCQNGGCLVTGCRADNECLQTGGALVCRPSVAGSTTPMCVKACSTPADCALGNVLYDADNYLCQQGGCVYAGCNTDSECSTAVAAGDRCVMLPGAIIRSCSPACTTAADCASPKQPGYDAAHYACNGGLCSFLGCFNDADCTTMAAPGYVCR